MNSLFELSCRLQTCFELMLPFELFARRPCSPAMSRYSGPSSYQRQSRGLILLRYSELRVLLVAPPAVDSPSCRLCCTSLSVVGRGCDDLRASGHCTMLVSDPHHVHATPGYSYRTILPWMAQETQYCSFRYIFGTEYSLKTEASEISPACHRINVLALSSLTGCE
jgi:hypothetical protein